MERCDSLPESPFAATTFADASASRLEPRPGVLIAEYSDMVLKVLSLGLRHCGFDVWQAANGMEALETYALRRDSIVLALIDVDIPELTGPQTLDCLHRLNPSLPVCFLTGGSVKLGNGDQARSEEEELLSLGAAHVFFKPVRFDELARTLRSLLGKMPDDTLVAI